VPDPDVERFHDETERSTHACHSHITAA
jgi:hypothetical protein